MKGNTNAVGRSPKKPVTMVVSLSCDEPTDDYYIYIDNKGKCNYPGMGAPFGYYVDNKGKVKKRLSGFHVKMEHNGDYYHNIATAYVIAQNMLTGETRTVFTETYDIPGIMSEPEWFDKTGLQIDIIAEERLYFNFEASHEPGSGNLYFYKDTFYADVPNAYFI